MYVLVWMEQKFAGKASVHKTKHYWTKKQNKNKKRGGGGTTNAGR